ncbi:GNAT family N-acetyltransferase [Secundilactobacillus folii]|uniref:GNAT family N-acetyltransferase n=1 Tax=Secundilactobacillus folii TaxID=2678357 RepID=A0A7X2XTX3_9LACO|nr:GNAT family N-acetyltransferase [Secundilactobacillus folii]MTV81574.1 GNAT family N-acetyltransferase [Secundilactobacillus folii]
MQIEPFKPNYHHTAQLVDLINYCQNEEAHLGIKMAEQDDIFNIEAYYQQPGGNFWLALERDQVVGCIALLPVQPTTAVLKKFFTYPKYRGQPVRLGQQLFDVLMGFAASHGFKRLVLDTPEGEHRSHTFYERQGFKQITAEQLGVSYAYPNRNSRLYELNL